MPGFSSAPAQVWLVVEPVDMRLGIDGVWGAMEQKVHLSSDSRKRPPNSPCVS